MDMPGRSHAGPGTQAFRACIVFPVGPIVAIHASSLLCGDIWRASYYQDGMDGGEVEPTVALFIVPILLIVLGGVLAALTVAKRWWATRHGARWLALLLCDLPRIVVVLAAVAVFAMSAMFFLGPATGALDHARVAVAWLVFASATAAFVGQQCRRVLE